MQSDIHVLRLPKVYISYSEQPTKAYKDIIMWVKWFIQINMGLLTTACLNVCEYDIKLVWSGFSNGFNFWLKNTSLHWILLSAPHPLIIEYCVFNVLVIWYAKNHSTLVISNEILCPKSALNLYWIGIRLHVILK